VNKKRKKTITPNNIELLQNCKQKSNLTKLEMMQRLGTRIKLNRVGNNAKLDTRIKLNKVGNNAKLEFSKIRNITKASKLTRLD